MFRTIKILSSHRLLWAVLIWSAIIFEGTALFFQYGMGFSPCVMCVYERVALFCILFSCLVAWFAPQSWFWRILGLILALISSIKGTLIALKHVDFQLHPSPWNQCEILPDFPHWLPLDKWLPFLFHPTGSCSDKVWTFLDLSMAQWISVMFIVYVIVFIVILISQFISTQPKRLIFHKNN